MHFQGANSSLGTINDLLVSWTDIENQFDQGGILLGNGFSCAVWDKFGYSSLFDTACSSDKVQNPLSLQDQSLFKLKDTKNFELVLSGLSTTNGFNEVLAHSYPLAMNRHEHIKNALGEAVRAVHIPWNSVSESVLNTIHEELKRYKFVYSTNYDLLLYWAVMSQGGGKDFKDYFWSKTNTINDPAFNIADTEIKKEATRVLYLHGALHLYRDERTERTYKLVNRGPRNLLEILEVPLFITEGSSEDKLRAISRSDYLSFAYSQFMNHEGPLVIFGHSLGETDLHLISALKNIIKRSRANLKIAISIYSQGKSSEKIWQQKANLHEKLCDGLPRNRKPELVFFDSQTHPLGSPSIRVESNVAPAL